MDPLYNSGSFARDLIAGELYDIGFDKPETHVIEKSGRFYYAFYAREYSGPVRLRGLAKGAIGCAIIFTVASSEKCRRAQ